MRKLALIMLVFAGCKYEKEPDTMPVKGRDYTYKKYDMSEEEDKKYMEKVMEWIDNHFDDPNQVDFKEKEYRYCDGCLFEKVQLNVTFRITNTQGVKTLHKVEFTFGGPTRLINGEPNYEEYGIMRQKVER